MPSHCLSEHYLLPSPCHILLRRPTRNQLIQQRLTLLGTQNPAQALDVFAFCAVATHNDCHAAVWHINAFVKYSTRNQFSVLARTKSLENSAPFLGMRLVSDARNTKATTNLIDDDIVF